MSGGQVRILHIITKIAVGGAQLNTLISTRDISKMGYPSDILTGPEKPPEGDLYDLVKKWNLKLIKAPHLKREISPLNDLLAFLEIRKVIRIGNYDIVHTHGSKARFLGRLAATSFPDLKIIQTAHGWPFYKSMNPLKKWFYVTLEKIGFRLAHVNIVVSARDRDKAVKNRIGHHDDYRIIRSGVEFDEFRRNRGKKIESRKRLGIPITIPVVGAVMRFCPEKAPDNFVSVAREILRRIPETLFVIVGDGPLMEQTAKLIDSLNLSDSFLLTGSRKDISSILPAFDLFLITSRTEGLPRALLETLAAGVPVVSTDVGGIHELVDGKRNGLIFPEGDIKALAEGVINLLGSPEHVTELLASVDDDIEPFSANRMVAQLFELYTNISFPAMNVVFLCDDEPFYIPETISSIIRKCPFNRYTIVSLPGHGSLRKSFLNFKRYKALYGSVRFFIELARFAFFKVAGSLKFPLRYSHSLRQTACREHIDYIRIRRINSINARNFLSSLDPDVFLSIACPQILRKKTLSIPRLGSWNVHSALLPKNRGMLPSFWSLFHGDMPGVTLHKMVEKLDAGEILLQKPINTSIEDMSVHQLLRKSKSVAAEIVSIGLPIIEKGGFSLTGNPVEEATFNSFPSKDDIKRFLDMGGSITGVKTVRPRIALSFDIEEWFQTYAARRWYPYDEWNLIKPRVHDIIIQILELLDAHRAKSTFFLLGWILERNPDLAQLIIQKGHEIGYHGYNHKELTFQTRDEFKDNLDRFMKLASSISIPEPVGFRAPSFSIISKTKWAIDEIVNRGYIYDSSVYPMFRYRYGIPSAPLSPFELKGEDRSIIELPLASIQLLGVKLPVAGGAYMRFYPGPVHRTFIKAISRSDRIPALYIHPWEIDSMNISSRMNPIQRFRQHHNSGLKTISRLDKILRIYRGITLRELADEARTLDLVKFGLPDDNMKPGADSSGL